MSEMDGIIELLNRLSPTDREEALAFVAASREELAWVPNPGPQTTAYFSQADEVFYGGQAGGGKGQGINNLALTPTGWKRIGDIKVGDKICATDGTVQEVLGVFPQGIKPLYSFRMADGGETVADADHNWLAWRTHAKSKKARKATCGADSARKWNTTQMLKEMAKGNRLDGRKRRFVIPVTQPVNFNVAGQLKGRGVFVGREIDPYILGLLLGDGSITKNGVSLTTVDEEIADYFTSALTEVTRSGISYNVRGATLKALTQRLIDLGLLGKKSHDKFIPRQYLFAPIPDRWSLLQGLMDSDGWVEEKRACYYVTVSEGLARDVEHLARSLGAVTTRTEKHPTYTHNEEKLKGQKAYNIRIKLPDPTEAFRLTRKTGVAATIQHQSVGRIIESIEYLRDEESICLAVSNANSLYITDDFIVTHNTDLILGLALTEHRKSLVLRRTNKEAGGLVERLAEILGSRDGWNGQNGMWRRPDGRVISIGGCQLEEDKQGYKGIPRDLYAFDEISDFTESQYRFIIGWNRSTIPGQRCRVIGAGNPPTRPEGQWVVRRWAAWLDPQHPNPAEPGELRWYTTDNMGEEVEVDGPGPHYLNNTEPLYARSRTFIPAELSDNPDLVGTGYQASLDSLPAELRAAYRDGNFQAGISDDAYQLIPSAWVVAAQARWTPNPPIGVPMCAIGCDVAVSKDKFVLAPRHDTWFAKTIVIPGREVADAKQAAGRVIAIRRDNARVIVDVGGGWGADCFGQLMANNIDSLAYMGVKTSRRKTTDGKFSFFNVRTEALWKLREALDPSQPGGSAIQLPPGSSIRADLCAPHYLVKKQGNGVVIMAESKEDICDKLGRSPDEGDAIVMSWYDGLKVANMPGGWEGGRSPSSVTVNRGKRYH